MELITVNVKIGKSSKISAYTFKKENFIKVIDKMLYIKDEEQKLHITELSLVYLQEKFMVKPETKQTQKIIYFEVNLFDDDNGFTNQFKIFLEELGANNTIDNITSIVTDETNEIISALIIVTPFK